MLTLDIEELLVESDEIIDNGYLIHCGLKDPCCACPTCGQSTTRVHAYYDRTIQDLPINGKPVYLNIRCRKLLCLNKECPKKIFSQRIHFARPKSKKTERLEQVVLKIAINTSLVETSKILKQLGIMASKSSVAELLKKIEIFVENNASILCIDDFSLRKRHSHGSILVDFQTKKVIDLFPSRNQEKVARWLSSTCQDCSFVIRDGAASFRNAISQAFPEAIQIADRFYILKFLTEHALKAIRPLIPKKICMTVCIISQPLKRTPTINQQKKQELVQEVKKKKQLGWTYKKIGNYFSLDPRTVKRYCHPTTNVLDDHKREGEYTQLDDYQELLIQEMTKQLPLKTVYTTVVEAGYGCTFETFRKTYKRVLSKHFIGDNLTKVHRKPINRLVFESFINRDELDDLTEKILNETPELLSIIQCVQDFRNILADASLLALDHWITKTRAMNNTELDAFINGLERDKDAVQNAMIFPELSNGLAEGKVNKLKKIKRIMFGRCSFKTLRTKMILSEL